eukprot:g711.t1
MSDVSGRSWTKILISVTFLGGVSCYAIYLFYEKRWKEKPQLRFKRVFCDNTDAAFQHLSTDFNTKTPTTDTNCHPYRDRILHLKNNLTPHAKAEPMLPNLSVPWVWVDSNRNLMELVRELKGLDRFALDVEFHRHHSYHGFICLVQLFTGNCIYLVDSIALHDELHILNEVFSDPSIRKILHGSHNDVVWLQKDFRVYLVNVFDTEKACQVLKKSKSNLAHLLEEYFHIKSDKSLQQADWRRRPLTKEQIQYAKMDVHYLLCLEDILKNELLAEDFGTSNRSSAMENYSKAVQKSHDLSLNLFKKGSGKEAATTASLQLIRKFYCANGEHEICVLNEDRIFLTAVYALCEWRDRIARNEDESTEYILRGKILVALAQQKPVTNEHLVEVINSTPTFDFGSSCTEATYWKPPTPFLSRIGEVLHVLQEVVNEVFIWKEGPALLNPKTGSKKWKSKKQVESIRQKTVLIYSAKTKVYENCTILSKEGELLCYCDRRRLDWYVRKKIAVVESLEPYVIRLLFQHQMTDTLNGIHEFYAQSRVNRCVSCGQEEHYLRYKVVPACYRRNFPVELKSHRSHDVVLLCIDCHQQAQRAADRMKKELAEEYGVPLICSRSDQTDEKISACKLRAAALALRDNRERIPPERVKELETRVHLFFGRDPNKHSHVDMEDLELGTIVGLSKRELKKWMKNYIERGGDEDQATRLVSKVNQVLDETGEELHGEQVIKKAIARGGIQALNEITRRFREVFVNALNPKYLPEKWNIEHFAPRQFGEHSVFYHDAIPENDSS